VASKPGRCSRPSIAERRPPPPIQLPFQGPQLPQPITDGLQVGPESGAHVVARLQAVVPEVEEPWFGQGEGFMFRIAVRFDVAKPDFLMSHPIDPATGCWEAAINHCSRLT
jgi:hypothetical protein